MVLVLLGVLAAVGGLMVSATAQRYGLEREAAAQTQKTEAALQRLTKELSWARPESIEIADSGRTVRWVSAHPEPTSNALQTVTWSGLPGAELMLENQPLTDDVDLFSVSDTVASGFVIVRLRTGISGSTHRIRVPLNPDL